VYIAVLTVSKISILLLYLRIFPRSISPGFRICCFISMGLCVAFCITFWSVILWSCEPIKYSWHYLNRNDHGRCIHEGSIYATAGINIALDLLVFFLPIPKLTKLSVSYARKAGICLTFLIGLFVTVCSIVRLQYLTSWGDRTNPSWAYVHIAIWSALECNLTVTCACMPMMAAPIKKIVRKAGWSKASHNGSRRANSIISNQFRDNSELGKGVTVPPRAISKTVEMSVVSESRRSSPEANAAELEKHYQLGPVRGYSSNYAHVTGV